MSRGFLACVWLATAGCPSAPEEESFLPTPASADGLTGRDDVTVQDLQLCVSGRTVTLIWMDDRLGEGTGRRDIWMNRSMAGGEPGTWLEAPLRINAGPGQGNVFQPALTCSDAGAFVVWEDDRDGVLQNHQIYFNGTVDGSATLGPDQLLELDADGLSMSLAPRIAAVDDTLTATWMDSGAGSFDIFVTTSVDAGASWTLPLRLDPGKPGSAFSSQPDVAVGDDGRRAWVAYEDVLDGVMLARTEDGGRTFWAPTSLAPPEVASPRLCPVADRSLYVMWYRHVQDRRDLVYRYSEDGGLSFMEGPQDLPTASSNAVAFDAPCRTDGQAAAVAWFDERDGEWNAVYAPLDAGRVGDAVGVPVPTVGGDLPATDFAVRDATVAVLYGNGSDPGVHYVYRGEAGELNGPFRIDDHQTRQAVDVQLALLGDRIWLAAWSGATPTGVGVFVQRGILGDEAAPQR